jgi:hypothetical protein
LVSVIIYIDALWLFFSFPGTFFLHPSIKPFNSTWDLREFITYYIARFGEYFIILDS